MFMRRRWLFGYDFGPLILGAFDHPGLESSGSDAKAALSEGLNSTSRPKPCPGAPAPGRFRELPRSAAGRLNIRKHRAT